MIVAKMRTFMLFFCTFAANLMTFKCYANEYNANSDKKPAYY
jgi:hypothetical protein